jgi:NADPH-dependent glutamate synthase beta subunit-like oxidoreductase
MVVQSKKQQTHSSLSTSGPMSRMASDLATSQLRSFTSSVGRVRRPVPKHVGIVGAGVASLRCSKVLLDAGVKVTILEARSRVGGRVSIFTDIHDIC